MVEPLVQGAAGMLMQPAGLPAAVRQLCDEHDVLPDLRRGRDRLRPHRHDVRLRAGGRRARPPLPREGHSPAATCRWRRRSTTERIYEGFLGDHDEFRTFFHGHTYTGNPLACAAALATLDVFEEERTLERLQPKIELLSSCSTDLVEPLPHVREVRQVGLHVRDRAVRERASSAGLRAGGSDGPPGHARGAPAAAIVIRPLGDVVVLMPPLAIEPDVLEELVEITADSIAAATAPGSLSRGRLRRPSSPISRGIGLSSFGLPDNEGRVPRDVCLLLVGARSPSCGRRRRGRTSRRGCPRRRCRGDAAVGVALDGVVDEPARLADPLLSVASISGPVPICEQTIG